MILSLRHSDGNFFLTGESFGKPVSDLILRHSIRYLFHGWKKPVTEGRGVLQVLLNITRGLTSPLIIYGKNLRDAADVLPLVLRLIAAGYIIPRQTNGEARWFLTVLPAGADPVLAHGLADLWMRTCASTTLSRAQAVKGRFYTADDAWISALRSPSAKQESPSDELDRQLRDWAAPMFEGGRMQLPLVPVRKEDGWHLTFPEQCRGSGAARRSCRATNLPSGIRPLQMKLPTETLRLLGQATAVAPLMSLPQPWDDARFLRFLREAVPALRAAAFSVPLPPELEAHVPTAVETAVSMKGDTVRVDRSIQIGDLTLSVAEAQAILDSGEALVFIHEAWHYIDHEALRRILNTLGPGELEAHRALPLLMAGSLRIAPGASDVQAFLREITQPPEVRLPLRHVLRPYQAQGVCWMMQAAAHRLGVCLADDMGLGKTLQTISLLLSRTTPGSSHPSLVVAPLTVLPVWEREFSRWAPNLRILRHDGPNRMSGIAFARHAETADVVLTAYGYLWRDYTALRRLRWNCLVLDEAQLIKNPAARQTQAARSLAADFRLALTGTPIENRLDDLWSILDFLNPDLFGTRRDFIQSYSNPKRLRRAVSHFLLRRLKSDPDILSELPPKIMQEHYAPLTPQQSAAYDYALAEYTRNRYELRPSERAGAVLGLLTRLKQICDHPGLAAGYDSEGSDNIDAGHSGKLLTLLPLLDDILEHGESVLIFTQFARMGRLLQRVLEERLAHAVPFVHGGLSAAARRQEIDTFDKSTRPGVIILSLRTGAFGLTLTKASHVVHFDRWWNPAVEAQATDRAHRIGQTRTVVVHHLICRGTLEDRIDHLLREKTDLAESIVAPTPAALLARLPEDSLLGLLERSETSVTPRADESRTRSE